MESIIFEENQHRGAIFGIIGVFASLIALTIAFPIYIMFNPSFSIENYPMSYLGTGPYGSGIIFSLGLIISGILLIPFYFSLTYSFGGSDHILLKFIPRIAFISCLGLILAGFFPFEETNMFTYLIHGFVSTIYFIGMSVVYFFYWLIELKTFKYYNYLTVLSFFTCLINGSFWIAGVIREYGLLDIPSLNYTVQWYGFFISMLWTLVHAIFIYRKES